MKTPKLTFESLYLSDAKYHNDPEVRISHPHFTDKENEAQGS